MGDTSWAVVILPSPARDRWADESKLGSLVVKEVESNVSEEDVVHAILLFNPNQLPLERVPDKSPARFSALADTVPSRR